MSNTTAIGAIGALAGAVVGLAGVLIGQYLTQRRHSEALRHSAELETQKGHDAALLKYLEVVGQLLTDPSRDDSLLSSVIRAQTMALLESLTPGHKRILMEFLYESNLIGSEKPSLSLQGANLLEANLEGGHLERANLAEANLERVNLEEANLIDADLRKANLKEANLVNANLSKANLRGANLKEADLSGAFLQEMTEESLTQAQIDEAVGDDATKLPDHLQRPAHWRGGPGGSVRRELK
jgi:uncharacterized protein YjbI with pentapeptide repeats